MSKMGSKQAERRARRQFSEEFRAGAVRLVLDEGKTVGAVARGLDLTPSALATWVKQARASRSDEGQDGSNDRGARRVGAPAQRQSRVADLERDILKKAAAFFAKDHL